MTTGIEMENTNANRTETVQCPCCASRLPRFQRLYCVVWTTTVDRPERRGASYEQVAAGTAMVATDRFSSAKAAKTFVDGLRRGEFDFASEYVSRIETYSVDVETSFSEAAGFMHRPEVEGSRRRLTPTYTRAREGS